MSNDIEGTNIKDLEEKKDVLDKIYKTKDYVRRANNKYRKKKYAEDPEFRRKIKESVAKSQEKKKDEYKEKKRNYMREYRAKKKAENKKNDVETETILTNELSTLKIDT